jgi:hypothetical protein
MQINVGDRINALNLQSQDIFEGVVTFITERPRFILLSVEKMIPGLGGVWRSEVYVDSMYWDLAKLPSLTPSLDDVPYLNFDAEDYY